MLLRFRGVSRLQRICRFYNGKGLLFAVHTQVFFQIEVNCGQF